MHAATVSLSELSRIMLISGRLQACLCNSDPGFARHFFNSVEALETVLHSDS